MKLRMTELNERVLRNQIPEIHGAAVTYQHEQSGVITACHISAYGVFLGFWQGTTMYGSIPLYTDSKAEIAPAPGTPASQRVAAAYSALAHVIGAELIDVDTSLFHRMLKLTALIAAHKVEDDNQDSDGYWSEAETAAGLSDTDVIEVDDEDAFGNTDCHQAIRTLRDMFYEYMSFDFSAPPVAGYWVRVWGEAEWQQVEEVDEGWQFVKLADGKILPSGFIQRYVWNRPKRMNYIITNDEVFNVLPELAFEEVKAWLAEPRVFNNVPDEIVADCETIHLDGAGFELSVTYKDGGPDSSTSRLTYTLEDAF